MDTELYSSERKAEFLLNHAVDPDEYRWAVREALILRVDPTRLEHLFRERDWQDPALYLPQIALDALRSRHA